jgi:hypothetical protein
VKEMSAIVMDLYARLGVETGKGITANVRSPIDYDD